MDIAQNIMTIDEKVLIAITVLMVVLAIISIIIFLMQSLDLRLMHIDKTRLKPEFSAEEQQMINDMEKSIVFFPHVGTGFIYSYDDENIVIVTNAHVLRAFDFSDVETSQYFTQEHKNKMKNKVFLPYIEFRDQNITLQDKNLQCSTRANKENQFKKGTYLNDFKTILGDDSKFATFYTHPNHDVGLIVVPKNSLAIAEEIKAIPPIKNDPERGEKLFVSGNSYKNEGNLTNRKGKFKIRGLLGDKYESNIWIDQGHSGAPAFNEEKNLVGIATSSSPISGKSFKIPFINYKFEFGGSSQLIRSDVVIKSVNEIKQKNGLIIPDPK